MSEAHPSLELQQRAAALLRQTIPTRKRWHELCRWIDGLNQHQRPLALQGLDERLSRSDQGLPDEVRIVPSHWVSLCLDGQDTPQLQLCRGINLQKPRLDSPSLIRLLQSPHWGQILHIKLFGHDLDDQSAMHLAQSSLALPLLRLNLTSNRIGNPGFKALCSGKLPSLTSLYLGRNNIDDEGARWLLRQQLPPAWEVVDLRENQISIDLHQPLQEHFSRHEVELRITPVQSENADPPLRRRKGRSRWSPKNEGT